MYINIYFIFFKHYLFILFQFIFKSKYIFIYIINIIDYWNFLILKKNILTKLNIYHKILTVVIGYIFLPVIISIPFYLSIYNLSFLNSYFEAISGFTSTGFTIFDNIKHIDESLIIWRSTSQWIGGLYFFIFDNITN